MSTEKIILREMVVIRAYFHFGRDYCSMMYYFLLSIEGEFLGSLTSYCGFVLGKTAVNNHTNSFLEIEIEDVATVLHVFYTKIPVFSLRRLIPRYFKGLHLA